MDAYNIYKLNDVSEKSIKWFAALLIVGTACLISHDFWIVFAVPVGLVACGFGFVGVLTGSIVTAYDVLELIREMHDRNYH